MKNIVLGMFMVVFTVTISSAQKINWVSFEEAQELTKKEPRKIIMDVYTTWCGPCKMLDKNTFGNKDVADYINKNFYAVKFNAEGNDEVQYKENTFSNPNHVEGKKGRNAQHQLARYLSVRAYPTIVFFDEKADLIAPISGYLVPKQIEIYLKLFKTDKYKEVNSKESWDKYQKEFVYEFKS